MKKILLLILAITVVSCSTSTDENGNTNTTVVPLAPTGLSGTVVSNTQINLSWTDNSTNEIGFKIERKTGSGNYNVVGTTNADITTFIDNNLTPATSYTYRVYAYNPVGNSLTYSNEISFTTSANTTAINVPGPNVTDVDGNVYASVTNCGLTFTKQNLNVSKYSDGTPIPQVTDPTQWANLTTGAWCYYNNDPANAQTYGKLYNWYAVAGIFDSASLANPSLRKKLTPQGWHIPSHNEWTQLTSCLGGESVAGGKMKSTGTLVWQTPNTAATNESGFTGLPGGFRSDGGPFNSIAQSGIWWSITEQDNTKALNRFLGYDLADTYGGGVIKKNGLSVRCLKD
jgi:uncharacterized protein (TIGR02145 family)